MRPSPWLLACSATLFVAAVSCNAMFGIDGLSYDSAPNAGGAGGSSSSTSSGGSSSSSTSSTGGVGGSGGGITAADWSSYMHALYRFESPSELALDSSGNGPDMTPANSPGWTSTQVREGMGALSVDGEQNQRLFSADAAFESLSGTSLTFGGWFRNTGDEGLAEPLARSEPGNGYILRRLGNEDKAECAIGSGTWTTVTAPPSTWLPDEWTHIVCRFDNPENRMAVLVDAVPVATATKDDVNDAAALFEISHSGALFTGEMDEVFFVKGVLQDDEIQRIYACGVNGAGCQCDPDDLESYVDCGRLHPQCTTLPPCSAPLGTSPGN